jgi:hypothetical protein
MSIKIANLVTVAILFGLQTSTVRATEEIPGKDIAYAGTVPMSGFMRFDRTPDGTARIEAWEVHDGQVVRTYDIDMTKTMHAIVVSDDLTDFQHVHPVLSSDGHLSIVVRLAEPRAAYHIYFDGLPHGLGRNVFQFDLPAQAGVKATTREVHAAGASVSVGPYVVRIDPTSVPIGEISTISVSIFKNGRPATDLHPYLGVISHGVLVGTQDLAYLHVHGMTAAMLDMASDDCGDSMMMQTPPLPPNAIVPSAFELELLVPSSQNYNLWLQFIGGKTVYTAPFLVTTK